MYFFPTPLDAAILLLFCNLTLTQSDICIFVSITTQKEQQQTANNTRRGSIDILLPNCRKKRKKEELLRGYHWHYLSNSLFIQYSTFHDMAFHCLSNMRWLDCAQEQQRNCDSPFKIAAPLSSSVDCTALVVLFILFFSTGSKSRSYVSLLQMPVGEWGSCEERKATKGGMKMKEESTDEPLLTDNETSIDVRVYFHEIKDDIDGWIGWLCNREYDLETRVLLAETGCQVFMHIAVDSSQWADDRYTRGNILGEKGRCWAFMFSRVSRPTCWSWKEAKVEKVC